MGTSPRPIITRSGGLAGSTAQGPVLSASVRQPAGSLHARHVLRSSRGLVLVRFIPAASTACYGKFQLVRKVDRVNADIDPDKWVRWFAFIVLSVVPIYALAFIIDLAFANSRGP